MPLSRQVIAALALAAIAFAGQPLCADFTIPEVVQPKVYRISDGTEVRPSDVAASTSGLEAIGVTAMRTKYPSIDGAGQTVVVIDSGIDYTHPALASRFIDGFYGVNIADNTLDPMDDRVDIGGHGTHVAGIIVSTDAAHPGVAPGAKVISLKVFSSSGGDASDASLLSALAWVSAHKTQYNITTVNMSLGDGTESTWSSIAGGDPYNAALGQLKNQGVFVSVASGNESYLHGQSLPAASPNAVSVGATYASSEWSPYIIAYNPPNVPDPYPLTIDGVPTTVRDFDNGPVQDDIAFFANRYKTATDGQTDLMAPGIFITSTVPTWADPSGFTDMAGTSMAAPEVAGASMLVRQALEMSGKLDSDPARQVDQILSILENTGTQLWDFYRDMWLFVPPSQLIIGGNNSTLMQPMDQTAFDANGDYYAPRGTLESFPLINVDAAVQFALPEPGSLALLATGVAGLLLRRRRR